MFWSFARDRNVWLLSFLLLYGISIFSGYPPDLCQAINPNICHIFNRCWQVQHKEHFMAFKLFSLWLSSSCPLVFGSLEWCWELLSDAGAWCGRWVVKSWKLQINKEKKWVKLLMKKCAIIEQNNSSVALAPKWREKSSDHFRNESSQ